MIQKNYGFTVFGIFLGLRNTSTGEAQEVLHNSRVPGPRWDANASIDLEVDLTNQRFDSGNNRWKVPYSWRYTKQQKM